MAKQSFFCNQQTTEEDKVGLTSFHMTKDFGFLIYSKKTKISLGNVSKDYAIFVLDHQHEAIL